MAKKLPTPVISFERIKELIALEGDCDVAAGSPLFLKYPDHYPMNPDGPPIPELVAKGKGAAGKAKPVPTVAKSQTRTKKSRAKK